MGYLGRYPMGMWLCIISESHLIYENVVIQCKVHRVLRWIFLLKLLKEILHITEAFKSQLFDTLMIDWMTL
jgi:hypothetical protein